MKELEFGEYYNKLCQFTFEDSSMAHGFIVRHHQSNNGEYRLVSNENKNKYLADSAANDEKGMKNHSVPVDISTITLVSYIENNMLYGNDFRFKILDILLAEEMKIDSEKVIMNNKKLKQLLHCSDFDLSYNINQLIKSKLTSIRNIGEGSIIKDSSHFITSDGLQLREEFERKNNTFQEYIGANNILKEDGEDNTSGFVGKENINRVLVSWQKMNHEFFEFVRKSNL